jgi:hypothetical protein
MTIEPTSGQHKSDRLQALPPEDPRSISERDTRRWCRGKVGVEHDAVWQFLRDGFEWDRRDNVSVDWQVHRCVNCGRQLDFRTVPSDQPSHPRPVTP